MKRQTLPWICFFLSAAALTGQSSSSARPTRPDRGFYPNGSFSPSEFDTVNNVNGNIIARVPITSMPPARGGAQFGVNLTYNSAIYDTRSTARTVPATSAPYLSQELQKSEHGGWQLGYQYGLEYENRGNAGGVCDPINQDVYRVHKMYLRTPDGSLHTLRLHPYSDFNGDGFYGIGPNKERPCDSLNPDTAPAGDLVYTTTDGSYIRVELGYSFTLPGCTIPTTSGEYWTCRLWRVFLPDGSEVRGYGKRALTMIDRNGNEIYLSSYVSQNGNVVDLLEDQAGRFIEIEKFVSPRKEVIRRLGYGQQVLEWELQYQTIQSVSGVWYRCANNVPEPYVFCSMGSINGSTSHEVISKIKFPAQTVNGTNYSFDFEYAVAAQNGWGELRTAYFPARINASSTRARLDFEYRWDNYTITATNMWPMRDVTFRLENPVKKRTLSYTGGDGVPRTEVWDYEFTDTSSTITLPDGSQQFANFDDVLVPWRWSRGLVYAETMPMGRSVNRSWQRNPPLSPIAAQAPANAFVSSESVNQLTSVGLTKTTTRTFTVDRNGNQTVVSESDWFTSPLRTTQGVYLYPTANATGAVPTVDEVNAYWRAGSRRSLRAVKRQRTNDANAVTQSLSEFSHDTNWNVTQARQWDSTKLTDAPAESTGDILNPANSVMHQSFFAGNGNPTAAYDANNNHTSFSYASIAGCSPTQPSVSDLYPTGRIEGANNTSIQRSFTLAYDCNTGVVTSETDTNNSVTTTRSYDAFGRPLLVTAPDGSRTEWSYQDGNYRTAEYHDVLAVADKTNATIRHFDDLGRLFLEQRTADQNIVGSNALPTLADSTPVNGILVEHLYAPPCRVPSTTCDNYRYEAVSTPYRPGGTDPRGWTRTKFDALGRPIEVRHYDGATKPYPWSETDPTSNGAEKMTYNADQTISEDPAGRKRNAIVDGFGRLIRVTEDTTGANYSTIYEYDVLDNLKKVTQGSQIRNFVYTSLRRLKSTTQPETGTINYTYDNNGNLLTRVDARGTMTIAGYDALNRAASKSWTVANTPAVQYTYDNCPYGKGRLCGVSASVGGSVFEYDSLGRPVKKTQTIGALAPYVMQQAYLPSGAISWMSYPSGTVALPRKVSHEYWPNGQLKAIWQGEVGSGSRYALVSSYHAAGSEKRVELGNLLWEDTVLNSRLQIANRSLTYPGTTPKILWAAGYDYGAVNDGNLKVQTITGWQAAQSFSFTQTYTYDNLSRLRTVKDSGLTCGPDANTSQKFVYDRYGNKAVLASSCGESSGAAVPFVANDTPGDVEALFPGNRLPDPDPNDKVYDNSGNQRKWAGKILTYDGENRLYQANLSATDFYRYSYDGDGKRIKSQRFTVSGVTETEHESTYYIYDANGQMIVETDGTTALGANPERKYLTADHLGSTRLMTKSTGTADTIVESRFDYYPYGEEIARGTLAYGAAPVRTKFTGQVRDGETGLDYFGARYFTGSMGRFTSPDPHNEGARPWEPQSWNAYSYAVNNPLKYIDPDGEDYQLCIYGECRDLSNAQYEEWRRSRGSSIIVTPGGRILDRETEQQIGTERWFDGNSARRAEDAVGLLNFLIVNQSAELIGGGIGVGAATALPRLIPPQLARNAFKGAVAERVIEATLRLKGYKIVGRHVTAKTSKGVRYVDYVVERGGQYRSQEWEWL